MFGLHRDKKGERELSVIQDCAATTCTYNENHVCEAGEIEVEPTDRGPVCATFEPEVDDA
jgi:hypothetical protein